MHPPILVDLYKMRDVWRLGFLLVLSANHWHLQKRIRTCTVAQFGASLGSKTCEKSAAMLLLRLRFVASAKPWL